jgi:HD-like signal output (HDOD) protein
MWEWLDRLFGRTGRPEGPPRPKSSTIRGDASSVAPALRVLEASPPAGPPFAQFLALVGQEAPTASPLTHDELSGDEALAAAVLMYFRQHVPGPASLPAMALQVLNAVADPETSLAELTRLVSQDPAMSAGVLRVANSPAYHAAQEAETLRVAVNRLGLVEVGRVAGMVAARSLFQPQLKAEFAAFGSRWNEIFAESLVSARGASWQALRLPGVNADHVFLAGLLHDVGRSVALRALVAVTEGSQALDPGDPRIDRVLERVHVEVGGEVHQHWNLPRFSTLVAMRHHDLQLPSDGEYREVHVVRLVSAMVQYKRNPWRGQGIEAEVDESCAALGLDGYALRTLDTQLRTELSTVAQAFAERPRRRTAT